ncbi:MAG: peptidylprolyl isomerase [Oscillospiraceae bacterium]|nr:peptidylprolyl isomerase [Oscillospiraceae bacterium]
MKYQWFAALTAAVMLTGVVCGCGKQAAESSAKDETPVLNYTMPAEGEEIVRISIKDYGDVTVKLFPELLPEACENFKELAKSGYYDELIFHRVMENFMIQGGDPKGDGTGGASIWGGEFDGGYSASLIHVPGALAYANSGGTATDGSQFYIVTGDAQDEEKLKTITAQGGTAFTAEAKALYCQYGGAPWLDGGNYTVFGQVIDGLDVVYAVSHVPTNENNKPKKAVYIEKMTVEQYDGSAVRFYKTDYAGLE